MKYLFSLLTFVSASMLFGADKVVTWNRLPNISESVNSKLMIGITPNQWFWTENVQGGSFEAVLLNPNDHSRTRIPFSDPKLDRILITGHALKANEFGVITALLYSPDGAIVPGLILLDLKTRVFRIVNTGNYVPKNPSVTADGLIWSLGFELEGIAESSKDFDVVRAYSAAGKLIYQGVPKSSLGVASLFAETNNSRTFADGLHFVAHLVKSNILIRIDEGRKPLTSPGPSMNGKVRNVALALCGGRLYVNAMSNETNYSFVQEPGGEWKTMVIQSDGRLRSDWLPQYGYCGSDGSVVAMLGYSNMSEIR